MTTTEATVGGLVFVWSVYFDHSGAHPLVRRRRVLATEPCLLLTDDSPTPGAPATPQFWERFAPTEEAAWELLAQEIDRHIELLAESSNACRINSAILPISNREVAA